MCGCLYGSLPFPGTAIKESGVLATCHIMEKLCFLDLDWS